MTKVILETRSKWLVDHVLYISNLSCQDNKLAFFSFAHYLKAGDFCLNLEAKELKCDL